MSRLVLHRPSILVTVIGIFSLICLHAGEVNHIVASDNLGKDNDRVIQSGGSWYCNASSVPLDVCAKDAPARDMIFSGTQLKLRYKGLLKGAKYHVRLTYLSDSPARVQRVYIDGNLVREYFTLPSKKVYQQRIEVTKSAIEDGEIEITVEKCAGPNAILSVAELLSDHKQLQSSMKVNYYGHKNRISGTVRDINNPNRFIQSGVVVVAKHRDAKVASGVKPNGAFSLRLPASWLKDQKADIELSCGGTDETVAFQAGDLLGGGYHKVVLDESCYDPFELAVAQDGRVFYIERRGKVKMCQPRSLSSKTIAEIKVYSKLDDGLLGLVLDPDFLQNKWMYLCYSRVDSSDNVVSRFTLEGDKLDLSSEKVLLRIPVQRDTPPCHTGGSLAFDAKGNLFISTGDNVNPFQSQGYSPSDTRPGRRAWDAQGSSADTNDLRGKILRITPLKDGTYTIPKGNLFPLGMPKTKPEIYVMGCRNPFRIAVDQRKGTLYWGEVGPDAGKNDAKRGPAGHDEINQAKQAGNYGWPHFVADNKAYYEYDFAQKRSLQPWKASKPINRSPYNKGIKKLPPAQSALIWYSNASSSKFPLLGSGGRCAMGGPVYYYDESLESSRKLGREFDQSVFFYDWMRGWIIAGKLDQDERIVSLQRFMPNETFRRPMDLELGPDGALYLLEWGSSYGGGNANAQVVRLQPGVHLNAVRKEGGENQKEDAHRDLLAKFKDSLKGGNVAKGKELFKSPKGGCMYCHQSDEPGGMIGPSLVGIGSRMTRQELLESIIFPSKEVAPQYLTLTIQMKSGATYSGTVNREDDQQMVLDTSESGAVTLKKDDIKKITKGPSPMPAGAGETISPEGMRNLIEYLSSLKTQ